jgi:O-antigen ligase
MQFLFLKDDQAGLLTGKDKILYFLVVIFLITFFLPDMPVVNNLAVGLIVLYSFFYNSFSEKFQLLRRRPEIVVMVLFYLLHIVSALISKNQAEGFSWAVMRLPLLVFPITIGLVYIKPVLRERIMYAYAVIVTLAALACLINAFNRSMLSNDASLLYNDNLTFLIQKQSVYMALLVNVAVFSFGYLIAKRSPVIKRSLVYPALLILLVINFLLASRIAIAILYGSIVCVAIWWALQKKRYLQLGIVVAGMAVAGLVLVNVFPKTLNRFRELGYTKYDFTHQGDESHFNNDEVTADQWNGANIRLAVWSCGWELVKQHPVFGVPLGDKVDRLMEVYAARHFDFAYKSRRNMHNNYLDVLVTFGLVGLLLFLWGSLFEPLRQCIRHKDFFGIFVIGTFMLSFIPETYFDRSMGNMIFAFFIAFIIGYRKPVAQTANV